MRVRLLAVGSRMPAWVQAGVTEYTQRLPREWRFEIREIAAAPRGKNADIARAKATEGAGIVKALPAGAHVVALDERGEAWSTVQLAQMLETWQRQADEVCLLIGGADGLAPEVLARAQRRWSLSKLTLPHALVRILVAEQLYRGWSLLAGHPYHRA